MVEKEKYIFKKKTGRIIMNNTLSNFFYFFSGYKSETHYRLEQPKGRHIRLLKASTSDEESGK